VVDIVSVDWNVEEFRRLIAEQLHSVPASGEKTARVLETEVHSRFPTTDNVETDQATDRKPESNSTLASSRPVEVPVESNTSDPIIDEVVATAIVLKEQIENPIPQQHTGSTVDTALQNAELKAANPPHSSDRISTFGHGVRSDNKIGLDFRAHEEPAASAISIRLEVPNAAPQLRKEMKQLNQPMTNPAEAHDTVLNPLRKAILNPDIYTDRADRVRAISLRWRLRDIAANRLKLLPVTEPDLQILVDLKLVEIGNDIPQLTSAGVAAIK
jgi:hypothetical protein